MDTTHWQPAPDAGTRRVLRQKLGIPEDSPALLFASLDHRRKGLGALLHALPQVPEARLWVAGQSLGAWHPLIQQLGLTSRVTGLGRADLLPWYQAADWFVHPTQYDACANTVLQSMACGLPGLISTSDGASEFITEGLNGSLLRHPEDPEAFASLLNSTLQHSETARLAMGHAARQSVLPLTWEAHLAGWMPVIQSTT